MSVSVNATTCALATTINKATPGVVIAPVHTPPVTPITTAHPDFTVKNTGRTK